MLAEGALRAHRPLGRAQRELSMGSTGLSRSPEVNTIQRWGTPALLLVHGFAKEKAEADFTKRPLRTEVQVPRKLLPSPFISNSPSRPPQQTHRGPSLGLGGLAESPNHASPQQRKQQEQQLCRAGRSVVKRDNEWGKGTTGSTQSSVLYRDGERKRAKEAWEGRQNEEAGKSRRQPGAGAEKL